MIIEELIASDLPCILEIWKRQGNLFGIPYKSNIMELINNGRFLGVRENGKIIAYTSYEHKKRLDETRAQNLWVAEKYRRNGIATELIREVYRRMGGQLTVRCKDGADNNKFYGRYSSRFKL